MGAQDDMVGAQDDMMGALDNMVEALDNMLGGALDDRQGGAFILFT